MCVCVSGYGYLRVCVYVCEGVCVVVRACVIAWRGVCNCVCVYVCIPTSVTVSIP